MATFGDWMRLLRIHSAALTWGIIVLGFIVAGGDLFSWQALLWAAVGVAWHGWGFVENSWCDRFIDKADVGKKDFPLVTGAITDDQAVYLANALLCITIILTAWQVAMANSIAGLILLAVTIVCGSAYNIYSKRSPWAWVALTFGWGLFPLIPVVTVVPMLTLPVILFIIFFLTHFMVNTATESAMKDLDSPERNVVKALGGSVTDGVFYGNAKTRLLAMAPKVAGVLIGILLAMQLGLGFDAASMFVWIPYGAFAVVSLVMTERLSRYPFPWNDHDITKRCVVIEVTWMFSLVFAMQPLLGWVGVLAMLTLPFLYFIIVNYLTFKTGFTPAV